MVGAEESHELWGLDNFNVSDFVNIEMSPGLGPVGVQIFTESFTADFFMGAENFIGSSFGLGFGEDEMTGWYWWCVLILQVKFSGVA